MYSYTTSIFLRDTDATGVLFFTEQMRLALEAFESFLASKGASLGELLESSTCLMPVVHVESDYFAPLKVSDKIEILLKVEHIGNSSFTLTYQIYKEGKEVGKVGIVHVTVDKNTRTSVPIPQELRALLSAAL
jgi:YbgC/YbaW family acyl-CoA thioester hydrolase